MKRALYLIGVPGAGKSTVMSALTDGLDRWTMRTSLGMVYEELWDEEPRWIELGQRREQFSGTDALSMSVQPAAEEFVRHCSYDVVLGEGDRLANHKFFDALKDAGFDLRVVLLDCPPELAAKRRAARGSNQNETWLAGRETKVENLRRYVTDIISAEAAPQVNALELRRTLEA